MDAKILLGRRVKEYRTKMGLSMEEKEQALVIMNAIKNIAQKIKSHRPSGGFCLLKAVGFGKRAGG